MRQVSNSELFDYLASPENAELLDWAIMRSDGRLAELIVESVAHARGARPERGRSFPAIPPREAYNYAKPLVDEYLDLPSELVQPEFLDGTLANAVKVVLRSSPLRNGVLPAVKSVPLALGAAYGIHVLANLAGLPEDISGAYAIPVGALVGTVVAWNPTAKYVKKVMETPACLNWLIGPKKIQLFGVDTGPGNVASQLEEYSHAVYDTFSSQKHSEDRCVNEGFAQSVAGQICMERGDFAGRLSFWCVRKEGLNKAKSFGPSYEKNPEPHYAGAAYFALLEEAEIAKGLPAGRPLREFYQEFLKDGC
jgi:hypothetical protein